MVKTPCFHCRGHSSIPGRGIKTPHASGVNEKNYYYKLVEDVMSHLVP